MVIRSPETRRQIGEVFVRENEKRPVLEQIGWQSRTPLHDVIYAEFWQRAWYQTETMPAEISEGFDAEVKP